MFENRPVWRTFQILVAISTLCLAVAATSRIAAQGRKESVASTIKRLKLGWLHPPRSCRPHTFWWWPGSAVTEEGLTWQLEQMREQGMGGVSVFSSHEMYAKGNIPYLSDKWLRMVRHTIKTAKKLDLEVAIGFGAGWNLGGYWVPPTDRSKVLTVGWKDLRGPAEFNEKCPEYKSPPGERWRIGRFHHSHRHPEPGFVSDAPDENKIIAVIAGQVIGDRLAGDSLVDLNDSVKDDDTLHWKVPEGDWRIMAFRLKYTGQQNSAQLYKQDHWTVNYFGKSAMQRYCDYLGGTLFEAFGHEFGKTVEALIGESFEAFSIPNSPLWSNEIIDAFRVYKGYDPTLYLPAIWWDIGELTPKIRYDFNDCLHWVGLDSYMRTFADWCEEHNLEAKVQIHHRFAAELIEAAGVVQRPETEVNTARFEVVTHPRKATAAGARFYGREIVSAEAYTRMHILPYQTTLEELKASSDAYFRDGVTQIVNQHANYSPEMEVAPDREWPYASIVTHWRLWWKYYHHLADYIARSSFLLRQGKFVGDILVYTPQNTVWTQRVLFGNRWRIMPYGNLGKVLVSNGYDFDPVNDDLLQNYADIEDAHIAIRGHRYRFFILPNIAALPIETLEFLRSFVKSGGIVIALDQLPSSSVGLRDYREKDQKIRNIIGDLFGSDGTGRRDASGGRTYYLPDYEIEELALGEGFRAPDSIRDYMPYRPTPPLGSGETELLETLGSHLPPDFALHGHQQSQGLTFIHRRVGELDLYFVTNIQPHPSKKKVTFRVKGKQPEKWDAMTGEIRPLHRYGLTDTGVEIPIDFAPFESAFIVFRPDRERPHVTDTNMKEVLDVTKNQVTGLATKNGSVVVEVTQEGEKRRGELVVTDISQPLELSGNWRMVLKEKGQARIEKELTQLASWTEDAKTIHFSGTAHYGIDFQVPDQYVREDLQLVLDLGQVGNVAEVILNGRAVGVKWMQPYRLDVTRQLRKGSNHLKVLVTNTLVNRVAGMKKSPEVPAELVPHYGPALEEYPHRGYALEQLRKLSPLPTSGLLGPVKLVVFRRVTVVLE